MKQNDMNNSNLTNNNQNVESLHNTFEFMKNQQDFVDKQLSHCYNQLNKLTQERQSLNIHQPHNYQQRLASLSIEEHAVKFHILKNILS